MSHDDVDLLVIGAGPAGSLVASLVRRENPERRVLVLEKETFPRHHIGESGIPSWRNILDRAGVLPELESGDFMRKIGRAFAYSEQDDAIALAAFPGSVIGTEREVGSPSRSTS